MLHPDRQLTFRPSPSPGIFSPLTVRSVGMYRLAGEEVANAPRSFTQLFWVLEGQLEYERAGWRKARAGEVFHYRAGEPHRVRIGPEGAAYHWITFDGDLVGDWLDDRAGRGPRQAGPCPVGLFTLTRESSSLADLAAEARAAELGLRLLIRAMGGLVAVDPAGDAEEALAHRLEELIEAHHTNPEFGIEQAADQLGRHRATLFRAFRKCRGISPSAYLQRLRIQRAIALLRENTASIGDTAIRCGFRDPNYFTKVIRHATGEPPGRIRAGSSMQAGPANKKALT